MSCIPPKTNSGGGISGEQHGLNVFFRIDADVFHTCSTSACGTKALMDGRALLEMTPWRQPHDFEEIPAGWSQVADLGDRKLRQSQLADLNYNSCLPRHLRIMVQAAGV